MNSLATVVLLLVLANLTTGSFIGLGRVIGGTEVDIKHFPYIVSIRFNDKHVCGGSIISTNSILTAAHCMNNLGNAEVTIRVGASVNSQGKPYKVATIFIHDRFNSNNMQYDVALMRLVKPLTFGPTVQAIALATQRPIPGTPSVVIGWGMFSAGSSISDTLRAVAIPLISSAICDLQYANVQVKITSQMLCAANKDASKSSCPGDSGGPLLDTSTGNLLGIVSFGKGCGSPAPGVYASVPDLRLWILNLL